MLNNINLTSSECQTFTDIEYNIDNKLVEDITEDKRLNNLLSTVMYKEKEEAIYLTEYYKTLMEYFDNDVYETTGLTITDMLNMDSNMYEDIINLINIKLKEKSDIIEDLKSKHDRPTEDDFNLDMKRLQGISV